MVVDDSFIEDEFNLCGLSSVVEHYSRALNILLDCEDSDDDDEDDELDDEDMQGEIERDTRLLYCLIHQRFLLSKAGMAKVASIY